MKIEIEKFSPCKEALSFRKKYDTFKDAWDHCPRGDWMLWIASQLNVDRLLLIKAKAMCANTVRHLMNDDRSKRAIDVALLYVEGNASLEELNAAADDAADAAYAADDATYAENRLLTANICRDILTVVVLKQLSWK